MPSTVTPSHGPSRRFRRAASNELTQQQLLNINRGLKEGPMKLQTMAVTVAAVCLGITILTPPQRSFAEPILKPQKYEGPIPQRFFTFDVGVLGGAENADMWDFLDRQIGEPLKRKPRRTISEPPSRSARRSRRRFTRISPFARTRGSRSCRATARGLSSRTSNPIRPGCDLSFDSKGSSTCSSFPSTARPSISFRMHR